jgi:hypothetical protein
MRPHVIDHLRVDALRRAAQCEFAQRRQIARLKIVADGPFCLTRHIDLTFVRRWIRSSGVVDQFDLVGSVDD